MVNNYLCRLCLTNGVDFIDIFSVNSTKINLREIISKHFECEVNEADALPNFVCQSCWSTTDTFHQLYEKSKIVEKQFIHETIKIKSDFNDELLGDDEQPNLQEPHFVGTFKDESDETMTLDAMMNYDISYETSQEGSDQSNHSPGVDPSDNASQIKPYLERWESSKKKKNDFAKLFSENKHRFDMSCDNCSTVFETLADARAHYANDHKISRGYIKCCNVKLAFRCKVIEHLYRHLDPEKYRCGECGKYFSAPNHLKTHIHRAHKLDRTKVEKKFIECDICKKEFSSKLYLRKHIRNHYENTKDEQYRKFISDHFDLNCDKCDAIFTTFYEAKRHYRDLHAINRGYLKCCNTKLNEMWLVIDHINSHLNPHANTCEVCEKTFSDRKKFYLHQRRHRQAILRPYICDHCGKTFGNKENITQHLFNKHVSTEPKFECELCHKRFQLMSLLKNHFYSVRREKKANVTCEICGKSFAIKANFKKHMLSHSGKSERLDQRQQCEHCGEWLLTKSGIYYHDQIHNAEIQQCTSCNIELPHKLALLAHKRKYHREPKYKCNYCGKLFDISSKLVIHEEGHTRHKLYPCDFCMKTFTIPSSLKTHIRRNHRDEQREKLKQKDQFYT